MLWDHPRIAAATTSDEDADILESYRLHANAYITKPIGLDQMGKGRGSRHPGLPGPRWSAFRPSIREAEVSSAEVVDDVRVRVLLVEDDPGDARLLRAALPSRLEIEHVTTLADAVAQLGRMPLPDVVLLDLSLPDSTGPATLQRLLAVGSRVAVVVLTGLDDDRAAAEAITGGAQDYLVKGSVTSDVMARAIRHAVERHRLQAALRERVKEAAGLFEISRVLQQDPPPSQLCHRVAGHLAEAMQWPELCHVRVVLDDVAAAAGPRPLAVRSVSLTAPITVDRRERGRITVAYTQPDRPFLLPEEQRLVDSAADATAGWLARKDAQRELVRGEERLRLLVSQLPGAVWTTDTDLRITSEAGAVLTQLVGTGVSNIGVPIDTMMESAGDERLAPFRAALAGESRVFERAWQGRWWRNHVGPKRSPAGDVVGTVCLTLDVTVEKRQQMELDAARERFQGLFANAADAMILADDGGSYIDVNPAACTLTGYDRDELLGMHAWDLAVAHDDEGASAADAVAAWRHFLAEGSMAGEFTVGRKDGGTVETDFRAVADIVPGVHLSTLRDITARKRAERALAASEARFRDMADTAQDAVYRVRTEPEVAYDYLNAAVETLSGFPVKAFYDNPSLIVERAHPDDVGQLEPASAGPDQATTVNFRFRHADGSWVWLEDRRSAIVEDGRVVGIQGVIRDITAREQTERALRDALQAEQQAAERLRAVDALKSGFLQAVSHELRTPLTSVLGYARTLVRHADRLTTDQVRDFHNRLATNATRLDALLTDLLDVERLNRGVVRLDLEPTDVSILAGRAASAVELGDRTCIVDDTPALAAVDARKVERILHNLLVNAAKHTPEGSRVWIACRADGDNVTITVSDDGPGIPEAYRDHVFEPFWQGPETQTAANPGTGIGLSLVRQFAALHGGRVWVDDRPGGGAAFHVSLPSLQGPAPQATDAGPAVFDASTSGHDGELSFFHVMRDTLNQLATVSSPDEAEGILLAFLEGVGAQQTDAAHPDAIAIDLSLDAPQPLRPAAALGTLARRRLENHLPFLLDHARRSLARNVSRLQAVTDAEIDPATGIVRPHALDGLLGHLHGHDALAVVTLQAADSHCPDDLTAAMRQLVTLARQLSRHGDQVVLTSSQELVLILPDTPEDRATAVINRLRTAWREGPDRPGQLVGVTVAVATGAGRQALEHARDLLR